MIKNFSIAFAVLVLTAWGGGASAVSVDPMTIELNASTRKSGQFVFRNDKPVPTAVSVAIVRVEMKEDGTYTVIPAPKDFTVFPPQRMIEANGAQAFRLQWAGGPLEKSQTYLVQVNQLPVVMPKEKTGVQVVFNFSIALNVAPASGTRALNVVAAMAGRAEDGKPAASLLLSNPGTVHANLSDATISLKSGVWSKTLSAGELRSLIGIGVVQPGKQRRFLVPVDGLPSGKLVAEVVYDKAMR